MWLTHYPAVDRLSFPEYFIQLLQTNLVPIFSIDDNNFTLASQHLLHTADHFFDPFIPNCQTIEYYHAEVINFFGVRVLWIHLVQDYFLSINFQILGQDFSILIFKEPFFIHSRGHLEKSSWVICPVRK